MRTMHLFAGVGGGLLADLILGHTPIIAVEWDAYACQVLRERAAEGWFPELSVWEGDVRLFDPSEYAGRVDCIHAGFPCQDISVAGNQAGVGHETRSGLYREVLRIAGIVRPRYLFLENVSAILGNGLTTVLADLAEMGFSAEWGCIRASDCGAPHHRDRWFLLADSRSSRIHERRGFDGVREEVRNIRGNERDGLPSGAEEEAGILPDTNSAPSERNECTKRSEQERTDAIQFGWWDAESFVGRVANEFSSGVHCCSGIQKEELNERQICEEASATQDSIGGTSVPTMRESWADTSPSSRLQQAAGCGDSLRQLPRETTRNGEMGWTHKNQELPTLQEGISIQEGSGNMLQSFMREQVGMDKSWWETESNVGRVAVNIPNRIHRLKGLGNAQVPLQAAAAWRLLGGE